MVDSFKESEESRSSYLGKWKIDNLVALVKLTIKLQQIPAKKVKLPIASKDIIKDLKNSVEENFQTVTVA